MASKLKVDNGKIKDGSSQVGMIKNGCIYDRNNASSSYCIGMVKNGTIYNKNNASSSYKVGTIRDAERVISGRCSDAELGALYILMKAGKF